jgi:hypothetical protein
MSYQEKRTITSMISGVLVLAAYCIYVFGKYQSGMIDPGDLKFWASSMLIFIGIGVGATIIIQIVFHIIFAAAIAVKKKECDEKEINKTIDASIVEDEMDKLIELKSMRISFIFAGIGFIAALVSLVLNYPPAVMLNIIFISCCLGSFFEGFLSLYYYRKGVSNS